MAFPQYPIAVFGIQQVSVGNKFQAFYILYPLLEAAAIQIQTEEQILSGQIMIASGQELVFMLMRL